MNDEMKQGKYICTKNCWGCGKYNKINHAKPHKHTDECSTHCFQYPCSPIPWDWEEKIK
jgi:hypothetical protein